MCVVANDEHKKSEPEFDDNIYDQNIDTNNPYLGWPNIENANTKMNDIVTGLNYDKYCVARFIVSMFRFLHFAPKFHIGL